MAHEHVWQKEPPDDRTPDDKYGDKMDIAHNSFWTSPEELQRLQLLLEKDPDFENSSDWPMLVEWCPSCGSTRVVKLVLPTGKSVVLEAVVKEEANVSDFKVDEAQASCEATAKDACTQTSRRRRTGGRGSRMKRLLAFQLMLSQRKGLPLSRLLTNKETDTRFSNRGEQKSMQEESASPKLNREIKEVEAEVKQHTVTEEKEEGGRSGKEVLSSGSTYFTLRSFPTVADPSSTQPLPHCPCLPPSPVVSPPPPLFTPPWIPFLHPHQFGQMPAVNWVVCGGCQMWGTLVPFWPAHAH